MNIRPRRTLTPVLVALAAVFGFGGATASAQLRVVNWNVAGLVGDVDAIGDVFEAMSADDPEGYAVAPALILLQEVPASIVRPLESLIADANPGVPYATATYTTSSGENGSGGAQFLAYRTDLLAEVPGTHRDIWTGAGRDADRWTLRIVGSTDDGGLLHVYSMHLKAGNSSSDAALREQGAISIRNDADGLPVGSNIIFAGDLNVYGNSEDAFETFLAPGDGQGFDPLGGESWSGPSNAWKHTQSPRATTGELIGGGMDDRFDMQLVSESIVDGDGIALMPGGYRALGNDGNHYNDSINSGGNSYYPGQPSRSNALADALYEASDHIPVISDLRIPGILSCLLDEELGRVVSGGSASINLRIANVRQAATPTAVAEVLYEANATSPLVGSGSGVALPLPNFATVPLALEAGLQGPFTASVSVTSSSPGVGQGTWALSTTGTAIRPAVPSWSAKSVQDSRVVTEDSAPDVGVIFIDVPIHNFGWDANQSALDLDSVSGLANGFFIWDGTGSQVTSEPGLLRFGFQTDGATPGVNAVDLVVRCTDEDVPGESSHEIGLRIEVDITEGGLPGDLNGNGQIDGGDIGLLLGSWGVCSGCPADLDGNGVVDGGDLGLILGFWGG